MFAERGFHFAKGYVSQLENILFGIQESQSKTAGKDNEMEQDFVEMRFWHYFGMSKTIVC